MNICRILIAVILTAGIAGLVGCSEGNRIAVMYEGKIIELFGCPTMISKKVYHPYTQTLLRQESQVQKKLVLKRKFHVSPKEVAGCRFFNHCHLYQQFDRPSVCREKRPELRITQDDHQVACHFCDGA